MSYDPETSGYMLDALQYAADHDDVEDVVSLLNAWLKDFGEPQGSAEKRLHLTLQIMATRRECPHIPTLKELVHDADVSWASGFKTAVARKVVAERNERKKGAVKSSQRRKQNSDSINTWLYPRLAQADEFLQEKGRRRGWKSLQEDILTCGIDDEDERRYVTEKRIKDWIAAGRPPNFT